MFIDGFGSFLLKIPQPNIKQRDYCEFASYYMILYIRIRNIFVQLALIAYGIATTQKLI